MRRQEKYGCASIGRGEDKEEQRTTVALNIALKVP